MLGQFLLDVVEDDLVEVLEGAVLVEPVELLEAVPDVADVAAEPVLVLDVLVAASATIAPPAMRPLVSAPTATTLRKRSFMTVAPFGWCDELLPFGGT
jgi:hypothetical protein